METKGIWAKNKGVILAAGIVMGIFSAMRFIQLIILYKTALSYPLKLIELAIMLAFSITAIIFTNNKITILSIQLLVFMAIELYMFFDYWQRLETSKYINISDLAEAVIIVMFLVFLILNIFTSNKLIIPLLIITIILTVVHLIFYYDTINLFVSFDIDSIFVSRLFPSSNPFIFVSVLLFVIGLFNKKINEYCITASTIAGDNYKSFVPEQPQQDDSIAKFKQIKELLDQGILTEEEYQDKKAEILKKI